VGLPNTSGSFAIETSKLVFPSHKAKASKLIFVKLKRKFEIKGFAVDENYAF
jgi:hypothetical protein